MATKEVAGLLVKMCREGKVQEAKQELFTEETLSIEPKEGILPKETRGLKAIQMKAELFISMVERFYSNTITDPVVAGDYFSIRWDTNIQMKGQQRETQNEICLYKVKDGKIVSEQFFYWPRPAIKYFRSQCLLVHLLLIEIQFNQHFRSTKSFRYYTTNLPV